MSILLSWFKSEKKKEIEELQLENESLKNQILCKKLEVIDTKVYIVPNKRNYKSLQLINDVLTVVLNDGDVLSKSEATIDDFNNIKNATCEKDVIAVISTEQGIKDNEEKEKIIEEAKSLIEEMEILEQLDDFEVRDNSVYLKGTSRTVPAMLVKEFIKIVERNNNGGIGILTLQEILKDDEEYQALKNFFLWCCLNPRAEVANDLYNFLQKNSFRITKQGFFVALRNVVTVHTENEEDLKLVEFVSNSYNKIKAVWKKRPSYFDVYKEDDNYTIHLRCKEESFLTYDGELLGDLESLYKDLPNMKGNRYTDAHTGTFDIRVGKVVRMPMDLCNWSTVDCNTGGLHFCSDHINYVGCGDTSVLILINPMKVVGIGSSKGRCYEYLPIMTVPTEESTIILHDIDFDTLELDEDYAIKELEGLAEKAKEGFVAETAKYSFNLPSISTSEIYGIVSSLEQMKETLSKRISLIK